MEETLAIVLKVLPRGEDDLLCDLLTEKQGRLWALARSARKSRKRFGSTLAVLNILTVHLERKASLPLFFLKESSVAHPMTHLQAELERLGAAFHLVEAVRGMTPEHLPDLRKFHLLSDSLQRLNAGDRPSLVRNNFDKVLLKVSGFEPHLAGCLRCGVREERGYFVYREGGIFCRRCLPPREVYEIVPAGQEERIFTPFLEYCIGKPLKSKLLCPPPVS